MLRRVVEVLRPERVTIAVTERPFAPAIAASRGEEPGDVEAWLEDLTVSLAAHDVEVEGRVVTSITGYTLYDTMEGLEADLLVVKAEPDGSLPKHMDWLYQVIPTPLLLVARSLKGGSRVPSRARGSPSPSSQLKVGLELGVFRLKLSNRGLEPIAFLFQGILHALHRCEVFIDSADSDAL